MKQATSWSAIGATISVNFLSFAIGAAYTWSSPVLPKLNGPTENGKNPLPRPITISEESWIASLLSLGATIGPILSGTCVNKFGRKKTLLLFSIPAVIAHLLFAFANHVNYFLIGRFLIGLSAGCTFAVIPMYTGEISDAYNRGSLGCIMGIMLTFGGFFSYAVGPFITIQLFSFINLIPLAFFIVFSLLLVPESPYYLISVNRIDAAADVLKKICRNPDQIIEKDIIEISKEVDVAKTNKGGVKELFSSKAVVRGLTISCGIMFFQQFCGICVIVGYMQSIFETAGSSLPAEISVILVGFVQLVVNLIASLLVDRLGRKILLLSSSLGVCLSMSALGTYFYLLTNKIGNLKNFSWMPIASLTLFIITFNIGYGPLPWAIMGELFPSNIKALATTITTCFCLSLAFLVTMFFPHLSVILGTAQIFWSFAVICIAAFLFVIFLFPETKGKTLQEIQNILEGRKK